MPDQDLLATCWTTAGDAAPLRGDERSPLPLRERVEATAEAGFRGIGLLHVDLLTAEREHGLAGIRSLLDDNGLVHLELELLRWVAEFAALAEDAGQAGTRVGLEFLPWSNIPTVHDGLRLVEDAGHDAGGLVIDVWHTERAGTPPAELAAVPLRHIVGVELSDAADQVGTLFEDTANRRRLCGEGAFDLQGCIKALRAAGWTGPWGVEILSEAFRRLPVREAAAAAFATAEAQLELAGDGR